MTFWHSQRVPGLEMRLVFQSIDHLSFNHSVYSFRDNERLSVAVASLIFPVWADVRCSVVESSTIKSCQNV